MTTLQQLWKNNSLGKVCLKTGGVNSFWSMQVTITQQGFSYALQYE